MQIIKMRNLIPFAIFLVVFLSGCSSLQLYYADKPKAIGSTYLIDLQIRNMSNDEYKIISNRLQSLGFASVSEIAHSGPYGQWSVQVNKASDFYRLHELLAKLSSTYDGETSIPILSLEAWNYQFNLVRSPLGASSAKYLVGASGFDPFSTVTMGELVLIANSDGQVQFQGATLNLSQAKQGIVSIIDSKGRSLVVRKQANGSWTVNALGPILGTQQQKTIEVEALR